MWLSHFVALLLRENVNYIQKKYDFLLIMEDMPLNPQSMIKIKVLQSWWFLRLKNYSFCFAFQWHLIRPFVLIVTKSTYLLCLSWKNSSRQFINPDTVFPLYGARYSYLKTLFCASTPLFVLTIRVNQLLLPLNAHIQLWRKI